MQEAFGLGRIHGVTRVLIFMLVSSVIGGLFGSVVLIAMGAQLARYAAAFSVAEYFWLYLLGLSCAVIVSRRNPVLALTGLFIGLLLSMVGLSAVHSAARFTFDRPELAQGIGFIPAMIGLFGMSEVMKNLARRGDDNAEFAATTPMSGGGLLRLLPRRKRHLVRSGLIGAGVGILPGAGADVAAWVSAAASAGRRTSGTRADEEAADIAMVSDATTANSAALAGAWIPALVFGIPGDSITAIVIGVLMMKDVNVGPNIFVEQGTLVYAIYLLFIVANLVFLPVGLLAVRSSAWIVRIRPSVSMPVIAVFCVIGAYAINGSYFDVWVMLAMGALGFVLERFGVPLGPVVLAIILGGPLEERFIQTLSGSDGAWTGFVDRPLSALLALCFSALWATPLVRRLSKRKYSIPAQE